MLPDGANATDVKNFLLNNCAKGKLNIAGSVPPSFVKETTNCLLYIKGPSQRLFHDVKHKDMTKLIAYMEEQRYAVSYMQSYGGGVNDDILFTVIFDEMGSQKYQTETIISEKDVKTIDDKLRPEGFKITFIYSVNIKAARKFIVVFSKSKHSYETYFKRTLEKQLNVHDKATVHGMTLCSTSVSINYKHNVFLYTTLYSNQSIVRTHNFYQVNKRVLTRRVDHQHVHGYYLKHLTSFTINGKEKYSLVFHQQTKPSNYYHNLYDVKPQQLESTVTELITNENKINVVARIRYSSSNIQYIITYESK